MSEQRLSDVPKALTLVTELEDALDHGEPALRTQRSAPESESERGDITIVVDGEQDHVNNASFRALLFSSIARNPGHIINVNMSAVTFIDPTALGTLVAAYNRANAARGDLRVSDPSQEVRAVLDITGTGRILLVEPAPETGC
jgi:anti-sigma B factor antagonist